MTSGSDSQQQRWSALFTGEKYYYGYEPGPVARRAVRYHGPLQFAGSGAPSALDAGCGEGQDLAFLAERGYAATGLDFTSEGVQKSKRLLRERGLEAEVRQADLRAFEPTRQYDLVIAVNSLQFMGEDALPCLRRIAAAARPGGVLGLSLFARDGEPGENKDAGALRDGIYYTTLAELAGVLNPASQPPAWQMLETAQLWQWNERANVAQPFVTLIARRLR